MKRFFSVCVVFFSLMLLLEAQRTFHLSRRFRHFVRDVKNDKFKKDADKYCIQSNLSQVGAIENEKHFVVIMRSSRDKEDVRKTLEAACQQNYTNYTATFLDTHDNRGLFEEVVSKYECQKKIDYQRIDDPQTVLVALRERIAKCENSDIIVSMERYNRFIHDESLKFLNETYQNSDVWITVGATLAWPQFYHADGRLLSDKELINRKFRFKRKYEHCPVTFYAGLFKKVALHDFFIRGKVIKHCTDYAFVSPMIEMASTHVLCRQRPLFIQNKKKYEHSKAFQMKPHFRDYEEEYSYIKNDLKQYRPLHEGDHPAKRTSAENIGTDLVVYSHDSPMELVAALSSYRAHLTGIKNIFVIYGATNRRFREAYAICAAQFPDITFIDKRKPREEICLLINAQSSDIVEPTSIAFASDNIICTKPLCLYDLTKEYENSGAISLILGHTIPLNDGQYVNAARNMFAIDKICYQQETRYPFYLGITSKKELLGALAKPNIAFSELYSYILFCTRGPWELLLFDTSNSTKPLTKKFIRQRKERENSLDQFFAGRRLDVDAICEAEEISTAI